LPNFLSLEFKGGPVFTLDVNFRIPGGKNYALDFRQLSDGQKALIALYALLCWTKESAEFYGEMYENIPTLLF